MLNIKNQLLISETEFLKNKLYRGPGVYVFLDDNYQPTYVGKSINIYDRVKTHLKSKEVKELALVGASRYLTQIKVDHELEALLLEASLIKKYLPKYNSAAKDDKHPLYIKITKEVFPKIFTSRIQEKGAIYFGPFPSSITVRKVLKQIRNIFPYCSQSRIGKRGCFYSHIGLCNPCPSNINNLNGEEKDIERARYMRNIKRITELLRGNEKIIKKQLKKEMIEASKDERYEYAAYLRDQLKALFYITSPYKSANEFIENPVLLDNNKLNQINALYAVLKDHISNFSVPMRIECFDNAHLSGKNATASLVAFVSGKPEKRYYRRFKIKTHKSQDDYSMMSEVIERRMRHLDDWGRPDLIVVDGGKGQVSAAKKIMDEHYNSIIPIIGIAKRLEELVIPMGNSFRIIRLDKGNIALSLIQQMRDEAHRFARSYHFKLRLKDLLD